MNSSQKKTKGVLKKVIAKTRKLKEMADIPEQRMTRFKTKAKSCSICYSSIETQGVIDSCKHEFCFQCIEKWSHTENTCPICKQRFSTLKKAWKRPFYGEKVIAKEKTQEFEKEPEKLEEIPVPTRNQGQANRHHIAEQLLSIVANLLSQQNRSEDFTIAILFPS